MGESAVEKGGGECGERVDWVSLGRVLGVLGSCFLHHSGWISFCFFLFYSISLYSSTKPPCSRGPSHRQNKLLQDNKKKTHQINHHHQNRAPVVEHHARNQIEHDPRRQHQSYQPNLHQLPPRYHPPPPSTGTKTRKETGPHHAAVGGHLFILPPPPLPRSGRGGVRGDGGEWGRGEGGGGEHVGLGGGVCGGRGRGGVSRGE